MTKHVSFLGMLCMLLCFMQVRAVRAQTWPSVDPIVPMWYEITDTSAVLHAVAYSAGWADLYVGGFLYAQCDTVVTDTLDEHLVDFKTPYTTAQWWVWPLVPQQSYCWWAYVRYDTTYYFAPNGIYFSAHASPVTGINEHIPVSPGYFDAAAKTWTASRDMVVHPVSLLGQTLSSPFMMRRGQMTSVSHLQTPCVLIMREPQTGTILGKHVVPSY